MERLRDWALPRRGWHRRLAYLRLRLSRLPDTPRRIARGLACGIFIGLTPFFGLHFPLAAALAFALRGNVVAAMIGTMSGNPVTVPLMAVFSLDLGHRILGSGEAASFSRIMAAFGEAGDEIIHNLRAIVTPGQMRWDGLLPFLDQVFLPYLVGALLPALLAAVLGYWLCLPALVAYRRLKAGPGGARQEPRSGTGKDDMRKDDMRQKDTP